MNAVPIISTNRYGKFILLTFSFLFAFQVSFAQHEHMHNDSISMKKDTMQMPSFFSPSLPMGRDGSGTSWQPDDSPMWIHMLRRGNTSFMAGGSLFVRYTAQDILKESNRGGNHFDAPNMFMFMLSQKLNKRNMVSVSTMFSLDPLTVGNRGYPLLFQTGETYNGAPLVDRQHPHDLFSGLGVNYTHSFTEDIDLNAYVGYPGEPALGPGAFMHRASAMNNPDAPLGHHWQDATHISFGVGTIGLRYKNVKAEGSIFTGREPDENRYDFDKPRFDSYSYRFSVNPAKQLAFQFSQGFIHSPEKLIPEEDLVRTTASLIHTMKFGKNKFVSSSFIWGMNSETGKRLNSVLLESNLQLKPLTVYGRYEFIEKDAQLLQLPQLEDRHGFFINGFTFGLNKNLFSSAAGIISLGAQATISMPSKALTSSYGTDLLSGLVYLKFMPPTAHVHDYDF